MEAPGNNTPSIIRRGRRRGNLIEEVAIFAVLKHSEQYSEALSASSIQTVNSILSCLC